MKISWKKHTRNVERLHQAYRTGQGKQPVKADPKVGMHCSAQWEMVVVIPPGSPVCSRRAFLARWPSVGSTDEGLTRSRSMIGNLISKQSSVLSLSPKADGFQLFRFSVLLASNECKRHLVPVRGGSSCIKSYENLIKSANGQMYGVWCVTLNSELETVGWTG